jgi:hypothetical protein
VGKEKKTQLQIIKHRWKPPNEGTVKININAGYNPNSNEGTSGCVVSDHTWKLLKAQALWYDQGSSSLIMEAEALRDGVRLAINMGLQNVIMETDALEVVNLVKDPGTSRSIIIEAPNSQKKS